MDSPKTTISVLLVDDHTLFRSGIRSLLQRQADFTVVGEAADGVEASSVPNSCSPMWCCLI